MRLFSTKALLPLAFLASRVAAAPTAELASRQNLPAGDQIQIQTILTTGDGCPPGTTAFEISADRTAVTIGFDQFAADVNMSTGKDKTCFVIVSTIYPLGCITSTVENTQHGFAELGAGVTGTLTASYSVSPGRLTNSGATIVNFSGGSWGDGQPWIKTDLIGTAVSVPSSNRNAFLIVNARDFLTTTNAASPGSIRTDDMTIEFTDQRRVPANQCS